MRIDSRDLQGLPVVTQSGQRLGKVLSFEVDIESHAIMSYAVGPRNWSASFAVGRSAAQYLIAPAQVLSITSEVMTVQDGLIAERAEETRAAAPALPTISPIASRSEE
ncbi:PRC-barrel domain-containing protein [Patescibacteria group bacterium]|nr:PRC-barrel domain-containing protein [Patescibacteria group bacterium]